MPHLDNGTFYTVEGEPSAPAILLIHGLGLRHEMWQWQTPALGRDVRLITFDLFGHGRSAAPPQAPSLCLYSEQAISVLDALSVRSAAIVGFSLGGMIARRVAQDHPDRVVALAILHSAHRRSPSAQQAIDARVAQAEKLGPAATVEQALERWFTDPFRETAPQVIDLVRGWVLANDPATYHQHYRVLAEGVEEVLAPDPPITCPTLVMTADEDFGNSPDMSRAIADEIVGAELVILQGLRHMALAEDPERTNLPLQSFLAAHRHGADA